MKYISTRGSVKLEDSIGFEAAVLNGLAPDGGLYIPTSIPKLNQEQLNKLRLVSSNFQQLAIEIISLYVDTSEVSRQELVELVLKSYETFHHPEVTPVIRLPNPNPSSSSSSSDTIAKKPLYLLELFHGPTYAFKDVALQFLGNLFEFFLKRKNEGCSSETQLKRHRLTVVGATSGDTGGAAIYGLRNKADVDVFILHPEGKVSPIQEAQMTMVTDTNVHNVSIPGDFDDCQNIVKKLFSDESYRKQYNLGAVNSINWARILAQIVYYFKGYFSLLAQVPSLGKVVFSVPTGNFGDILAGHYARKMGLPIQSLIIATNRNDILHRVFSGGEYFKIPGQGVVPSHSPAMDILVSSNFERLLFYLALESDPSPENNSNRASATLSNWMNQFNSKGSVQLPEPAYQLLKTWFHSSCIDDSRTVSVIRDFYHGKPDPYLLDPHTAVGVGAAQNLQSELGDHEIICLATAHPAKFQSAVELATRNDSSEDTTDFSFDTIMGKGYLPEDFKLWMDPSKPRKCHRLPDSEIQSVKDLISSVLIN